jgi:hypothetical protein
MARVPFFAPRYNIAPMQLADSLRYAIMLAWLQAADSTEWKWFHEKRPQI